MFNKSICFAIETKDITIGYGSRSMIYYELKLYDECLINIGFVRKDANMPAPIKYAVDEREAKCLQAIAMENQNDKFGDALIPNITITPHSIVPHIAKCLELRENKKIGRYIVTTKDLKVGDVVAVEELLGHIPLTALQYEVCENCCQECSQNLMACPLCTAVMFCSESCYNEAFKRFHKYECVVVNQILHSMEPRSRFALRLILRGLSEYGDLDAFLDASAKAMNEKRTIFDIDENNQTKWTERYAATFSLNLVHNIEIILLNVFQTFNNTSDLEMTECLTQLQEIIKQHILMIHRNYRFMDELRVLHSTCLDFDFENPRLVMGMAPFTSMLNHSCFPNIEITSSGNKLISSVLQPIKAGQELYACYR